MLVKFKVAFMYPVDNIAEKAVCRSVFLTIWHCNLSAELTKTLSFRRLFWRFYPLGSCIHHVPVKLIIVKMLSFYKLSRDFRLIMFSFSDSIYLIFHNVPLD